MRIALTSLYLPGGSKIGVGYQVHGLANALIDRGHEVTVFSQCEPGEGAKYQAEVVPARSRGATFGFAWDLRRVDFSGFDVLNAHGDDWFLWGKKRPWHVHTYHGSCLAEMMNIPGWKGKLRMGTLAVCEQQAGLLADVRVTVSENTKRYVKGIQHVVPCGTDLDAFQPRDKADVPTLLFVGTMHGRKRGAWLLKIFHEVVKPAVPNARLWCVCDQPKKLPAGYDRDVTFWGRVSEKQLCELYSAAWLFTLPSTYEGFGVPYIEAMASGTAVVATPNPGSREVTADGRYGAIADDRTLGTKIIALLSDSSMRKVLEAQGLERSLRYGWQSICEQYENLYTPKTGKRHPLTPTT
jgi:glycosyltransferase involved in cell wall biosynthesis